MWIVCNIFNSIFRLNLFYLLIDEKYIKAKLDKTKNDTQTQNKKGNKKSVNNSLYNR